LEATLLVEDAQQSRSRGIERLESSSGLGFIWRRIEAGAAGEKTLKTSGGDVATSRAVDARELGSLPAT
jgi:hypothetical protein